MLAQDAREAKNLTDLMTVSSLSLLAVRGKRTLTTLAFLVCSSANHSICSMSPVSPDGESRSSDSIGDGDDDGPVRVLWVPLPLL